MLNKSPFSSQKKTLSTSSIHLWSETWFNKNHLKTNNISVTEAEAEAEAGAENGFVKTKSINLIQKEKKKNINCHRQLWISNKSWISKNNQKVLSGPWVITFGQNLNSKFIKNINF